jgi:hypothetical protein
MYNNNKKKKNNRSLADVAGWFACLSFFIHDRPWRLARL